MATTGDTIIFARDELGLIVEFAAGCSLDESPGSNFVQDNGGLPNYICRIAKAIKRSGKSTSQAIAIAISRCRKWAAGGDDVDADTRAKAAKAIAEWDALRARSKTKTAAKNASKVAASRGTGDVLVLANTATSFNVDDVKTAWRKQTSDARSAWYAANPNGSYSDGPGYSYVREMWSDHLIAAGGDDESQLYRVGYSVDGDGAVTFDDPTPVKVQYVAIKQTDMVGAELSGKALAAMAEAMPPCHGTATDKVLLSIGRPSALEQILMNSRAGHTNVSLLRTEE